MAKDKKSNPVNQKKSLSISTWISFLSEDLLNLSLRVSKCINALKKYGDVPSHQEITCLTCRKMDNVIKTIREKYGDVKSCSDSELNKLVKEHIHREYDDGFDYPKLNEFIEKNILSKYDEFPNDGELIKLILAHSIFNDDKYSSDPELIDFIEMHILINFARYKCGDSILDPKINDFIEKNLDQEASNVFNDPELMVSIDKRLDRIKYKVFNSYATDEKRNMEYVDELIGKSDIYKQHSLELLRNACIILALAADKCKKTKDTFLQMDFLLLADQLRSRSCEAIGYWTAKLEHMKRSKNQETKQQQEAIKEKYVTETWLKMINNPAEKKALESLSQNKIAKRIQEKVMTDLKNVKTATGKYVLTRTKKIDKEGKTILSGLSTDTIIAIMRRPDKFTFNPFKNNASK